MLHYAAVTSSSKHYTAVGISNRYHTSVGQPGYSGATEELAMKNARSVLLSIAVQECHLALQDMLCCPTKLSACDR